MASKGIFVLLLAVVILQITTASIVRKARDTPTASDAGKSIDEAVESVRTTLDDFLKNVQSSDVFKELGDAAKKFGEQIESQGKDLIAKIQSSATPGTTA